MALVCAREAELDFGGGLELQLGSASINKRVTTGARTERADGPSVDRWAASSRSRAPSGDLAGPAPSGSPSSLTAGQGSTRSISFKTPIRLTPPTSPTVSVSTPNRTKSTKSTRTPAKLVKMGLFATPADDKPHPPSPASPTSPSRFSLHPNPSTSSSLATALATPLPSSPASAPIKRRVSLLGLPLPHLPTLRRAKSEKRLRTRAPPLVGLDGDGHRVLTRRTSFPSLRRAREVRSCSDPGHGGVGGGGGCEGSEEGEEEEEEVEGEGEGGRTPPVAVRRTRVCFGVGEGELSDEEGEVSSVGHGVYQASSSNGYGYGAGRGGLAHSYAMEGSGSSYSSYSSIESSESHASAWSTSTDATSTGSGSPTISLIASTPTKMQAAGMPWLSQPGGNSGRRASAVTWAAEPDELRWRESPLIAKHASLPPVGIASAVTGMGPRHASLPSEVPIGYDPYLQPIRNCHLDTPPVAMDDGVSEPNPYLTSLNYPPPQPHRYTISAFHYQTVPQPASTSIGQRLLRRRSAPLQASQPSLPPGAAAPVGAPHLAAQGVGRLGPALPLSDLSSKGAGMGGLLRRASASLTGAGGRPLSVVQAASGAAVGPGKAEPPVSPARERRVRSKSSGYGMGLEVVREDGEGWTPGVMAPWATYGTLKVSHDGPAGLTTQTLRGS